MESIGERIKEVRKELKLTQREFADSLGITQANISAIEKNISNPSLTLIKLLCIQYKINEEWIVNGNGNMSILSNDFETSNISGLLTKMEQMDYIFKNIIKDFQNDRETLFYIEESFAFFIAIISESKLTLQFKAEYYKEVYTLIDKLEKYIFDCSTILHKKKLDSDKLLQISEHQIELQNELSIILRNISKIYIANSQECITN